MAILLHIDNEVPGFGEWDSSSTTGTASVEQLESAGFAQRGRLGLRVSAIGGTVGLERAVPASPTGVRSLSFLIRVQEAGDGALVGICRLRQSGGGSRGVFLNTLTGSIYCSIHCDNGANRGFSCSTPAADHWQGRWVRLELLERRATAPASADGSTELYLDGVRTGILVGLENWDTFADVASVSVGVSWCEGSYDKVLDFDEIRIADELVGPLVPEPAADLGPRHLLLLWSEGDVDGRAFADECCYQHGVPLGSVVRLPAAAASAEILADYAAFQSAIEHPLGEYLSLHPAVAEATRCIVLGPGVAGGFLHEGTRFSATSRLMNLARPFEPGTFNPLHSVTTACPLRATDLGETWLCTRMDATPSTPASTLLARGTSPQQPADGETLFCDDPSFADTLTHQRTRLLGQSPGVLTDDAITFAAVGNPQFVDPAGCRAIYADPSVESAADLPQGSGACAAALDAGYAAALGTLGESTGWDRERFFRMLLCGGTVAEAVAVATLALDGPEVALGWPLRTVAFPQAGVNIYGGPGGLEDVDFTTPVACMRAGQQQVAVPGELAGGRQVFVARAVSADGVEEQSAQAVTFVDVAPDGSEAARPLPTVADLTAEFLTGGDVRVECTVEKPAGWAPSEAVAFYAGSSADAIDVAVPLATVVLQAGSTEVVATLSGVALPVFIAAASLAQGRQGPLCRPVCLPGSSPQPPTRFPEVTP